MKKRLLMQLLAVCCAVGAYAYNVGDYIYSNTARFKVESANMVENGTFANGLSGWTDEDGGEVNGTAWGVTLNAGPGGLNVLESLNGTPDGKAFVGGVWTGISGLYAISFWIKAPTAFVSSATAGNSQYIDYYVDTDGLIALSALDKQFSNARDAAEPISVGTEWMQVVDTLEVHTGEYFVFAMAKLPTGTQITDVQLNQVSQVYDIREAQRLLAYAEAVAKEPDMQNGVDEFNGLIDMVKGVLLDPTQSDSPEAMEGLLLSFNEEFENYMDQNAGNTRSGDWSTRGSANWNNINNNTVVGSWKTLGDRWGFSANDGSLERPAGDGYVLSAGIQTGYNQENKGVKVVREDLTPGKYFFYIEAQAVASSNKSAPYGANYNKVYEGPSIFVGTDTLVMRPATEVELADETSHKKYTEKADTLSGYHWQRYYYIGEVKEGETVEAGFIFPNYTDSRGGRLSLRNPQFRQLGKTTLVLDWEAAVKAVAVQQAELKNRLDTYPGELADYKWEQDSLQRAIAIAQPILDESWLTVAADGTCSIEITQETVTQLTELRQDLLDQVNAMGRARNWVINQNAIQETLATTIAEGEAVLADELGKERGDATLRSNLDGAVSLAKMLQAAISTTNQYNDYNTAITAINDAIEAYKISFASRKAPAPIQIKNGDFSLTGGNKTGTSFTDNGWNFTGSGTYKQWQFGTAGEPSFANQWRGSTVTLGGKAQQVVTLTLPGLYEYRCRAYAGNDNLNHRMGTAEIINDADENPIDTTYFATPARLFFGKDGAPDSIVVSKCIAPGANNSGTASRPWRDINGYTAYTYSVFYEKTTDTPEEVEFGLEVEALEVGKGLNMFGFGENAVYFVGKKEAYISDTNEDLTAEVDRANNLIKTHETDPNYSWLCVKLKRYIAQGLAEALGSNPVKGLQNTYFSLKEINDMIEGAVAGIAPITADQPVAAQKEGIYTLSGMKVSGNANSLKPGLYIINGKKYLVK